MLVHHRSWNYSPNKTQVDSAKYYANEAQCAEAIAKSGIDRSKIFYTSKVPASMMTYEKAKKAIQDSIADAQKLGYIDLYVLRSLYFKITSD